MPPIGYPGNSVSKAARAKAGGGFESAVENAAQRVISGTGFGTGPTVVLFDRFEGEDLEVFDTTRASIGAWDTVENATGATARYAVFGGRSWFSGRDPSKIGESGDLHSKIAWLNASGFSEFSISLRFRVPDGFYNPGATSAGTHSTQSTWKLAWLAQNVGGNFGGFETGDGDDLVVPSHTGSGTFQVVGNDVQPRQLTPVDSLLFHSWRFNADNVVSYYQGPESSPGANDAPIDWIRCNGDFTVINSGTADPNTGGSNTPSFSALRINGYYGNQPSNDFTNVWPLYADAYLSIGSGSRASVFTGNALTLKDSTEWYQMPPLSWADNEVIIEPNTRENLAYVHLKLADGTIIDNAEGI